MNKKWEKTVISILKNPKQTGELKCPNCGELKIDYLYVGESESRIGYLQIWCTKCLKGTYISRIQAPKDAKFILDDENIKEELPVFEIE